WFPAQPLNERIRKNSQADLKCLYDILFDLYIFHMYQGDILGANDPDDFSSESPELDLWIESIVNAVGEDESYVANLRKNPNWFYFRSFSAGFSIFRSSHIARTLNGFVLKNEGVLKVLKVWNHQSRSITIFKTQYHEKKKPLLKQF
ncbi:MAG: hypothetical protein ACTINA_17325, partial [Pseudoalteromonas distincta]